MSVEENKSVVRVIFDGFNARELGRVAAICADDFVLEDLPAGVVLHGPEGMRQWLQVWVDAAPDAHAALDRIFGEGDWVATEHHGTATHTGPLRTPGGVIPPTGGRIDVWFSENYQLRDGKLVRMRVYYDGATVLRQLGLIPEPAGAAA